jgi:hypothetical protein
MTVSVLVSIAKDSKVEYKIENIFNVYQLKEYLSEKLGKDLSNIFIYSTEESKTPLQNLINYEDESYLYSKITKNRCATCQGVATFGIGDCVYCKCNYCNIHRLPETHKCPKLESCRKQSFDMNFKQVISQKCVISQI